VKKRRSGARTLVAVLVVLGAGILCMVNSFWGNPISAAIATTKIEEYVKINYPEINAQIEPVFYSFKNGGSYHALVQAADSVDTVFRVNWYNGGRIDDDYRYEVANQMTTLRRLDDDLDKTVDKIIAEQFPYETRLVGCSLMERQGQLAEDCLVRDMPLDIGNPPLPIGLVVWCSAEHPDYAVLAERMLKLRDIMEHNNIPVAYYSVSVEYPYVMEEKMLQPIQWDNVTVHEFPVHRLNEGNLPAVLEKYFIEWEKAYEK
jgi:hypothetical protein